MTTLFLGWQETDSRRWYTVGRLEHRDGDYLFGYTNESRAAQSSGFTPLVAFPETDRLYRSDKLFPLFDNRVLSKNRPEYADYLRWLDVTPDEAKHPFALLARGGSTSAADALEVFPAPQRTDDGRIHFSFFVRGLRHQPKQSSERANALEPGEPLLLMADIQNTFDPEAFMLRTAETYRRDMHGLGYLPRYLAGELRQWDWGRIAEAKVTVVRVNPPPAPVHLRILANLSVEWRGEPVPFSADPYAFVAS